MKIFSRIVLLVIVFAVGFILAWQMRQPEKGSELSIPTTQEEEENKIQFVEMKSEKGQVIKIFSPRPGDLVSSPIQISGEVQGNWYFEATFPVVLVNWDGVIIAEGFATAQDEWMTTDYVPFTASLVYTDILPTTPEVEAIASLQDFMKKGTLILRKDNPSGLPEHEDAVEIPVMFE